MMLDYLEVKKGFISSFKQKYYPYYEEDIYRIEKKLQIAVFMLNWLEDEKENKENISHIISSLKDAEKVFYILNRYIERSGYIKLAKRTSHIIEEMENYKQGIKNKSPKLEHFFDDFFGNRLPTRQNILTLLYRELEEETLSTRFRWQENILLELDRKLINDYLNYGKSFKFNARYKKIIIDNQVLATPNRTRLKKDDIFKY